MLALHQQLIFSILHFFPQSHFTESLTYCHATLIVLLSYTYSYKYTIYIDKLYISHCIKLMLQNC